MTARASVSLVCICTCLASAVFIVTGLALGARSSATFDEVPHIAAGVQYLKGDLRFNREHPPLVKVLAALALPERKPALTLRPGALPAELQWSYGAAWLHSARQSPLSLLQRARAPLVLLNAGLFPCLAWLTYLVAGSAAACCAVLLAAFCPLWLAHGTLVTTDAPGALFGFASVASGVWLSRAQTGQRLLPACALAVLCALAVASKYSYVLLAPLLALGMSVYALRTRHWVCLVWTCAASLLGTLSSVCLSWGLPPKPDLYLAGLRQVGANHDAAHVFYAFGETFHERDPLYFARALLVKVSLPVILLSAATIVGLVRARRTTASSGAFLELCVSVALGLYVVIAYRAPAVGVRYVLHALPFMFVGAGIAAARLLCMRWGAATLAALLCIQLCGYASALRATPLAYFNGLFCFTGDALPCLDDSNLDWGQALPDLQQYRAEYYPDVPLRILYFGSSPVSAYVTQSVQADLREMTTPKAALYAVSLNHRVRSPPDHWTRQLKPRAIVAGVYAIYDLRQLVQR